MEDAEAPPLPDWTPRGGGWVRRADCWAFCEDRELALHGVFRRVEGAASGIGLRLTVRPLDCPSCAIWITPLGTDEVFEAIFDLQAGAVEPRSAADRAVMHAEIAQPRAGVFDLWAALRKPASAYRIDIVARRAGEASARYHGDGRAAFELRAADVRGGDESLLALHAQTFGADVEADFATTGRYYSTFFREDVLARVLEEHQGPSRTAAGLFDALLDTFDPRPQVSPRDLAARWLSEAPADALKIDCAAQALADLLDDPAFAQRLRQAPSVRAAIETPFPSNRGADFLRTLVQAERAGVGDTTMRAASPQLLTAALLERAGVPRSGPYLAHLNSNRFCFAAEVLSRQFHECVDQPMQRRGFVLVRLDRAAGGKGE